MSTVTIEKVFSKVKETKRGEALSVGLKLREEFVEDINGEKINVKDKWVNAFFPKDFDFPFKDGDTADLLIVQDGEYINFKIPGVGKAPTPDIASLVKRVQRLEEVVFDGGIEDEPQEPQDLPDPDDF
jgi:hypothetical protein